MRKERFPIPQANISMKLQDKSRMKTHIYLPHSGPIHELKQKADWGLVQPQSSGNCERPSIKGKVKKNDELIKYMSDVPGYLQHLETGENLQEKALSFGVMDWSRLEKWNHKQEIIPVRGGNNASSSNGGLSRKTSAKPFGGLSGADHCKSPAQRMKPSTQKVFRFQDIGSGSKSTLEEQKKTPWTYRSFGENCVDEKGKRIGLNKKISSGIRNLSPNSRNYEVPYRIEKTVRAWNGKANIIEVPRKEEMETSYLDERVTKELQASSSNLRIYGTSRSAEENVSAKNDDSKMMRLQEIQESADDFAHQNSFSENGLFTDAKLTETDQNEFSSVFFPSQVPHSCPFPCRIETSTSGPDTLAPSQIDVHGMDLKSGACPVPHIFMPCNYAEKKRLIDKPMDSNLAENPKVLDQAVNEGAEREGRSTTPNHRFRFGLGRMTRSCSLKEGSAVPQLSSIHLSGKSGPIRSEPSDCLDSLNKEKRNLHNKARSSPLRRLINPLLKSKVKNSAETVCPSKLSLSSSSFRSSNASESASEFLDSGKPAASTIQAFLQLTVKNGLPLFRFVADGNHVLAATMRNFTTPEKDDSSENFTFYSVSEIKKRSGGWMNQGSKEKKSEFVYDVVGRMKVSSPRSSNQYVIRESVLFGVEVKPEELAAVVVKFPCEILSHGAKRDKDMKVKASKDLFEEHKCLDDNDDAASIVAILPGGLHSLPEKGLPSPLVDRWRSGGLCDCGGWDMGCVLRVLSNYDQYNKLSRMDQTFPIPECFQLYVKEGGQQERPIFSLAPIKNDVFSIAFGSSISLLQAFFMSVAVLNCQKLKDISVDGNMTVSGVDDEVPARYIPNPPHSPVGRV